MYTIDEIKELAKAVSEYKLEKIKVKTDDGELLIEGKHPHEVQVMSQMPTMMPAMTAAPAEAVSAEAQPDVQEAPAQAEAPVGNIVKAPIVGTFYSAASPDEPPFVKVGDTVKKGDVLMIIESMKLMNEVTSEFDGVVDEIFAANGEAVEYDQPLMRII